MKLCLLLFGPMICNHTPIIFSMPKLMQVVCFVFFVLCGRTVQFRIMLHGHTGREAALSLYSRCLRKVHLLTLWFCAGLIVSCAAAQIKNGPFVMSAYYLNLSLGVCRFLINNSRCSFRSQTL